MVNASLGGRPASRAVDIAADATAAKCIFVVAAGGNDTADACEYSPGRASEAFTIGATAKNDGYADYSNHGPCVQLLAPGTDITSSWIGGGTRTISGTSMAAPHVTGVAALHKQAFGDRSQEVIIDWMWRNASLDKISSMPVDTPNVLLFTGGL